MNKDKLKRQTKKFKLIKMFLVQRIQDELIEGFDIQLFFILYLQQFNLRAVSMQAIQKTQQKNDSNHFNFKKKELKKKISDSIHICQCGRQFLSFPAIYSHTKTKHNFKISSRIGDQGRKIVEKDSQIKIYYQIYSSSILEQNPFQQSQSLKDNKLKTKQSNSKFNFINKIKKLETPNHQRNIYAVMIQFLNQSSHEYSLEAMNFTAEVMDLLTTCINEHYMHYDSSKVSKDYCCQNTAETVPLYFNFFLIWYLPSKEKEICLNFLKIQALLKIFFQWLRASSYTDLDHDEQKSSIKQNFWKKYFLKCKQIPSDQKQQTVTKKQVSNESQQIQRPEDQCQQIN